MPRPTKLTPGIRQKICKAIAAGNFYEAACRSANVHFATFRRWMVRGRDESSGQYREFREAVHMAQSAAETAIVAGWRKHVSRDWRAARDFLARRFSDRWGPKDKHEVTGAKGGPLVLNITEKIVSARPE
jgi:hypothetical protein